MRLLLEKLLNSPITRIEGKLMRALRIGVLGVLFVAGVYSLISNLPDTKTGSDAGSRKKDAVASIESTAPSPIPQEVADLLKKEQDFNNKCRDGIGSDPDKMEFCIQRDAVFDELTSKGWCWGKEGQAEYQMEWHPCQAPNRSDAHQVQDASVQTAPNDPSIETEATDPSGQSRPSFSATGGFRPSINGTTNASNSTISEANHVDPYAGVEQKAAAENYRRVRGQVLDVIRNLYFAVGCKVFASEAAILPLISAQQDALFQQAQAGSGVIIDRELKGLMQSAARDGMTRASNLRACDYWKSNPQAVLDVRRLAEAAR
jgi:hypothetical protein